MAAEAKSGASQQVRACLLYRRSLPDYCFPVNTLDLPTGKRSVCGFVIGGAGMPDMRQRIESLSPRQLDILVHVARHLSSREIGRILGLSTSTVDTHVATALQKLGLGS